MSIYGQLSKATQGSSQLESVPENQVLLSNNNNQNDNESQAKWTEQTYPSWFQKKKNIIIVSIVLFFHSMNETGVIGYLHLHGVL